ncbi:sodium-dependent noradrenaline transporter-like [Lineus longissimus]|uniref:sodium-dependent noradrenaline transporter-like n=1 Tax=Lineus longissimus TaxID=88925 RepID=UPI002B4E6873
METDHEQPRGIRGSWMPRTDFIFCCLSWTFSVGHIWRLPNIIASHGGVVFLIPYACAIFVVGYPMMFMELSMGQFASSGVVTIWECCPLFKGIGYAVIVMLFLSQVNIYAAWSLHYLVTTCVTPTADFPWSTCLNAWNTNNCVKIEYRPDGNWSADPVWPDNAVNPADEYFSRNFLEFHRVTGLEDTGRIQLDHLIALAVVWVFVFFTLIVGHYSMGKVAYMTTSLPSIFVIVLAVRGATLPGSVTGLRYMFHPDFDFNPMEAISRNKDAYATVIYEYGLMYGVYTMLGSYNKRNYNFYRDSAIVTALTVIFSLLCVLMIAGFLGHAGHIEGRSMSDEMTSGTSLVFIAMPSILSTLSGARVWLCVFFLMIFMMAFGSQMLATEAIVTALTDEWFPRHLSNPRRMVFKSMFAFLICAIFFALGVPYVTSAGGYVLTLLDNFAATWTPLFLCLFACIAITWVYGVATYAFDVQTMLGHKPNYAILGNLLVLAPLFLTFVIIARCIFHKAGLYYSDYTGMYQYPWWAEAIGWSVTVLSLLMVALFAFIHILRVTACNKNHSGSSSWRERVFGSSEEWTRRKEHYLASLPSDSEPTSAGDSPNDKLIGYPVIMESRT